MEAMRTDNEAFKRAVLMNDHAHRKTIREVGAMPEVQDHEERQEVFREINREARMWLRHLDVIHSRVQVPVRDKLSQVLTEPVAS